MILTWDLKLRLKLLPGSKMSRGEDIMVIGEKCSPPPQVADCLILMYIALSVLLVSQTTKKMGPKSTVLRTAAIGYNYIWIVTISAIPQMQKLWSEPKLLAVTRLSEQLSTCHPAYMSWSFDDITSLHVFCCNDPVFAVPSSHQRYISRSATENKRTWRKEISSGHQLHWWEKRRTNIMHPLSPNTICFFACFLKSLFMKSTGLLLTCNHQAGPESLSPQRCQILLCLDCVVFGSQSSGRTS